MISVRSQTIRVGSLASHCTKRSSVGITARRNASRENSPGLIEVIDDYDGDTCRAIYTVKLAGVYVLHVFQKKSTRGIDMPKHELITIRERWQRAKAHHAAHYHEGGK